MIYRFKSKATADLIMLGPQGDQVLKLMGKQPGPQGIIEVHQMPAAIEALKQAVAADDALRAAQAQAEHEAGSDEDQSIQDLDAVTLRQRAWPMVTMLNAALTEHQDIVWGV
jgi:hypothetical protein